VTSGDDNVEIGRGINIYHFPTETEMWPTLTQNHALLPFCLVASHEFVRVGSKHMGRVSTRGALFWVCVGATGAGQCN